MLPHPRKNVADEAGAARAHDERLDAAALRPWTPVFIHGDLQVTHVVIDADESTGVLDWSEVVQGEVL